MRLSKSLGLVSVLALALMGAGAAADDDHSHFGDSNFGRDHDHDNGRDHDHDGDHDHDRDHGVRTATPIKHVVVIFQENVSFDHYFGTYPNAANTDGQPFHAARGTPAVDGLTQATSPSLPPNLRHSNNLLTSKPNYPPP